MYLSDFDEYERPIVKIPVSPCHKKEMQTLNHDGLWACPKCGLVYYDEFIKEKHTRV